LLSLGLLAWGMQTQPGGAAEGGPIYLPFIEKISTLGGPGSFLETFDGAPASPQPWNPARWDVTVHSRDANNVTSLQPMHAQHGPGCEGPPATHPTNSYEEAVFNCRDHVMTAIKDDGYGLIYLTPNVLVDFSAGTAIIRFDMSTLRISNRDWIDLWITPFEDNVQMPLQSFYPDLNGPPRRAFHLMMSTYNGDTPFRAEIYTGFDAHAADGDWWTGYETFLEPSATRRDTFELHISQDHIKFGMPDYSFWWIDRNIPDLDWTRGIVQLGHHSYTPEKDCIYPGGCGPNTWHWDNFSISPAVPFTLINADRRYVTAATTRTVNLASPAPANAYLRFAGIGNSIDVSYDDGTTWTRAQQPHHEHPTGGSFSSYWVPIPAGVSQVRFRGQAWWGGGWQARDISVWSLEAPTVSQ
jgi:hypothetical protein